MNSTQGWTASSNIPMQPTPCWAGGETREWTEEDKVELEESDHQIRIAFKIELFSSKYQVQHFKCKPDLIGERVPRRPTVQDRERRDRFKEDNLRVPVNSSRLVFKYFGNKLTNEFSHYWTSTLPLGRAMAVIWPRKANDTMDWRIDSLGLSVDDTRKAPVNGSSLGWNKLDTIEEKNWHSHSEGERSTSGRS